MQELLLILHGFVDIFSAGRSDVKIILFCILLIISSTLFYWRKKRVHTKKMGIMLVCALVILYGIGLSMHLSVLREHNLPIGEKIIMFDGDEISSSTISHTHELKSAFGFLIQKVYPSFLYVDPGIAWSSHMNIWLSTLVLALTLCSLYAFFYLCNSTLCKDYRYYIVFFFVFFIALKNSIDGGVLNHEVVGTILFLCTVYIAHRLNNVERIGIACIIPLTVFVAMDGFYIQRVFATYLFLLSLILIFFSKKIFFKYLGACCIIGLIFVHSFGNIMHLRIAPEGDDGLIFAQYEALDMSPVYQVGDLYVYQVNNMSVREVENVFNVNQLYNQVKVEWRTCLPTTYKQYNFRVISQYRADEVIVVNNLPFFRLALYPQGNNLFTGELVIKSCFDVMMENQLLEMFSELNITPALFVKGAEHK